LVKPLKQRLDLIRTQVMMNQNEQTESATAVALAVFDFIQLVGDEMVYDINRAIDLIDSFGNERARQALAARAGGKVVQLRLIRGSKECSPRDCL
jgi:hypothetical protein